MRRSRIGSATSYATVLYTGCRIGEITSLKAEQFKIDATGIDYITIRDSKTLAGIRDIPLHPIAKAYIYNFIEGKNGKIFKYAERDGKGTGNAVGKKFARNLESVKIYRDKLVFHSLRKFLNNELMKDKVSIEARCQFMGHELDNVNVSTYSNSLNIDELAKMVFPTLTRISDVLKVSVVELENFDFTLMGHLDFGENS